MLYTDENQLSHPGQCASSELFDERRGCSSAAARLIDGQRFDAVMMGAKRQLFGGEGEALHVAGVGIPGKYVVVVVVHPNSQAKECLVPDVNGSILKLAASWRETDALRNFIARLSFPGGHLRNASYVA